MSGCLLLFLMAVLSSYNNGTFSLLVARNHRHALKNSFTHRTRNKIVIYTLSNLNDQLSVEEETNSQQPVSTSDMISAISLTAGTTIGAGILGLPSFSLAPGFIPSSFALLFSWVYMCSTGLLVAEVSTFLHKKTLLDKEAKAHITSMSVDDVDDVNVNDDDDDQNGIISMIDKTLGANAKILGAVLYVFIHYALLVAYISEAGAVLSESLLPSQFPPFVGPLLFTSSLFSLFSFGSLRSIENVNNVFVLVVLASFFSLIGIALPEVPLENNIALFDEDYSKLISAFPVMLLALVYHNIIPTISTQLQYNRKSITTAISIGSFIPLCMFIMWNFLIIGLIPSSAITDTGSTVIDPVNILITTFSSTGTSTAAIGTPTALTDIGKYIPPLISVFSEAAVITSFIGFVFGLSDFFRDLFPNQFPPPHHHHHSYHENDDSKSPFSTSSITPSAATSNSLVSMTSSSSSLASLRLPSPSDVPLYSVILLPPLVISICFPDAFTGALSLAGTYGIALLFCILPAAMALSARQMFKDTRASSSNSLNLKEAASNNDTGLNEMGAFELNNNNNNNKFEMMTIVNDDVRMIDRSSSSTTTATTTTTTTDIDATTSSSPPPPLPPTTAGSKVMVTSSSSLSTDLSSDQPYGIIESTHINENHLIKDHDYQVFVPGGSIVLYSIIAFATFIILAQSVSFH